MSQDLLTGIVIGIATHIIYNSIRMSIRHSRMKHELGDLLKMTKEIQKLEGKTNAKKDRR